MLPPDFNHDDNDFALCFIVNAPADARSALRREIIRTAFEHLPLASIEMLDLEDLEIDMLDLGLLSSSALVAFWDPILQPLLEVRYLCFSNAAFIQPILNALPTNPLYSVTSPHLHHLVSAYFNSNRLSGSIA